MKGNAMITLIINLLLVAVFVALLLYCFICETDFKWHVENMEEDFQNFLARHLFSEIELREYRKAKDEIKYQEHKAKFIKQFGDDFNW